MCVSFTHLGRDSDTEDLFGEREGLIVSSCFRMRALRRGGEKNEGEWRGVERVSPPPRYLT